MINVSRVRGKVKDGVDEEQRSREEQAENDDDCISWNCLPVHNGHWAMGKWAHGRMGEWAMSLPD